MTRANEPAVTTPNQTTTPLTAEYVRSVYSEGRPDLEEEFDHWLKIVQYRAAVRILGMIRHTIGASQDPSVIAEVSRVLEHELTEGLLT